MSFIRYLVQGVNVDNRQYDRFNSQYQQESIVIRQPGYQYDGNLTSTNIQSNCLSRIIDGVVEIKTIPDSIRHVNQNFWKKRRIQSLNLEITGRLIALASGISTIISTTQFETIFKARYFVLAGCALTIVGIGLSILAAYRQKEAHEQYTAWQDPFLKYQQQRRQAQQDFPFIYSNQLKDRLLHPGEIFELWKKWTFNQMTFYQKLMTEKYAENCSKNIKDFFHQNPLDQSLLNFAYDNNTIPEAIQNLSQEYEQIKMVYSGISNEANKQKLRFQQLLNDLPGSTKCRITADVEIQKINCDFNEKIKSLVDSIQKIAQDYLETVATVDEIDDLEIDEEAFFQ